MKKAYSSKRYIITFDTKSESKVVFALIPLGCVALKCYGLI